jgi:type II restriction/modification system DNA methylase subunit YeeA
MNTSQLSKYAPEARKAFIAAVSAQAARLGITAAGNAPAEVQGDVLLISGKAFPSSIAKTRKVLVDRIHAQGYDATMEAVAYTWFNRLMAIRFMELHGYLDHGYRVLSDPEGLGRPEILDHAADVDLSGLDRAKAVELKLDGTRDEELYRLLLKAQCNALHQAMPFLFEEVGAADELLLPANLLHSDSLIRNLVEEIPEDLWQDIEIIGWLYQFYISEKKDQVIGKVVKSEDIPAATQLFTPNWIVKYMVQNSLGAQWLATYPDSPLKGQMDYYIEPAEQTDEVSKQLAAITPSQLNPEELTLIDPASGSGHILVEAYELFKAIYLERGYRQRDVPQLILEKNLFGLDIDERAAQLTGFALMMKGRADDRRLFERGVKLKVMALVDSAGFDAEALAKGVELSAYELKPGDLTELKRLFEHATTFGSLIQVPEGLAEKLPALKQLSEATSLDLFVSEALKRLGPLVQQAELLAAQYDSVVANPPYIGSQYLTPVLKKHLKESYSGYDKDVFAAFIDRDLAFSKPHGRLGFMSPFVWMFISSHERLRTRLVDQETITSLVQLEYSGFEGATVPICTFTLQQGHIDRQRGCYIRLAEFRGSDHQGPKTLEAIGNRKCGWFFEATQDEFRKIPGSPVAYWVSDELRNIFAEGVPLRKLADPKKGLATTDNDRFLRLWFEVSRRNLRIGCKDRNEASLSGAKWFPLNKGGGFRKWYGNKEYAINWAEDGRELKAAVVERYGGGSYTKEIRSEDKYFRDGITWSALTSSASSFRLTNYGALFDSAGSTMVPTGQEDSLLGLLNTPIVKTILAIINPTLNFGAGSVANIPVTLPNDPDISGRRVQDIVSSVKRDWDDYERSWDFQSLPLLTASSEPTPSLESSYTSWITQNRDTIAEMKRLEEENNRLFIDAYGLADELTPDVPIEQITLTVNPAYRYGGKLTEEEQWTRFRQDTMEELVSYAIGCMMGRYSLDAPGLIYAHSGNTGFDPGQYTTFPADDDGIVPLTDTEWFDDDACNRVIDFIAKAWPAEHLEVNLTFIADNLGPKRSESSRDTIRRYLNDKFFKDHLQAYKKRPIYWLFSSGKQKAFQCLVYLHRYNEGTLARMRSEYVIPLQGKMAARLEKLQGDIQAATSTAQSKRLDKERAKLEKQQAELLAFDEKLRHYADMRINLDLDDGVKVNYGKFGDLLAEVKAIHGKKPEA